MAQLVTWGELQTMKYKELRSYARDHHLDVNFAPPGALKSIIKESGKYLPDENEDPHKIMSRKMTRAPTQRDLNGEYWCGDENSIVGEFIGLKIKWPNDQFTPIKIDNKNRIELIIEGHIYVGYYRNNTISWSDGEVWTKKKRPQLKSKIMSRPISNSDPPDMLTHSDLYNRYSSSSLINTPEKFLTTMEVSPSVSNYLDTYSDSESSSEYIPYVSNAKMIEFREECNNFRELYRRLAFNYLGILTVQHVSIRYLNQIDGPITLDDVVEYFTLPNGTPDFETITTLVDCIIAMNPEMMSPMASDRECIEDYPDDFDVDNLEEMTMSNLYFDHSTLTSEMTAIESPMAPSNPDMGLPSLSDKYIDCEMFSSVMDTNPDPSFESRKLDRKNTHTASADMESSWVRDFTVRKDRKYTDVSDDRFDAESVETSDDLEQATSETKGGVSAVSKKESKPIQQMLPHKSAPRLALGQSVRLFDGVSPFQKLQGNWVYKNNSELIVAIVIGSMVMAEGGMQMLSIKAGVITLGAWTVLKKNISDEFDWICGTKSRHWSRRSCNFSEEDIKLEEDISSKRKRKVTFDIAEAPNHDNVAESISAMSRSVSNMFHLNSMNDLREFPSSMNSFNSVSNLRAEFTASTFSSSIREREKSKMGDSTSIEPFASSSVDVTPSIGNADMHYELYESNLFRLRSAARWDQESLSRHKIELRNQLTKLSNTFDMSHPAFSSTTDDSFDENNAPFVGEGTPILPSIDSSEEASDQSEEESSIEHYNSIAFPQEPATSDDELYDIVPMTSLKSFKILQQPSRRRLESLSKMEFEEPEQAIAE